MYTEGVRWRWVFSSCLLLSSRFLDLTVGARRAAETALCGLFQVVFPDDCRVCGDPLKEVSRVPVCSRCLHDPAPLAAEFFCADCHAAFLNRAPLDENGRCTLCRLGLTAYDSAYSFGPYEGSLRKLVHLFKYSGMKPLAKPFGQFMTRALPRDLEFDAVVPMPLHWRKRWTRQFNQAELLAAEVARRWGIPLHNAVKRVKSTSPQAGLTNAKRRQNVSAAFAVRRNRDLDGLRILLVDDVLTTGATASACARVLKRAGARQVTVLTLARTDRRAAFRDQQFEGESPLIQAAGGGSL
jgi:ComF family protein